jgi:CRISPR-associated RAMP protein (TIGR02581 family)
LKRVTWAGTLRFPYGFHTGDGRRLGAVDQPLFREPDGGVALSGASLAGVLRSDLERLARESAGEGEACRRGPACRCVVCRLMGPRAERRRGADEEGLRASRLHVLGGRAEGAAARVRDRVGIDRRTRTAADRRKYDVEVLDGGAEVPFELRLDDPEPDELLYLEAALSRLAGGWLFLGGKTSSGLGRAEVARLERRELDLGQPERLVAHLLADEPTAGAEVVPLVPSGWAASWDLAPGEAALATSAGTAAWGQVRLGLALSFPLGFLVNDPVESLLSGLDHTFVRAADGRPVLPGSALRGALRSRAERILRTLGGNAADTAACDLNRKDAACHEAVEKESRRRREAGEQALSVDQERARHCLACRVFGSGRLASPVKLTDFPAAAPGSPLRHEYVAVDRFTGGAAEGKKFNAEAAAPGVVMAGELHLEIGPGRLEDWGLGLLALVLRDLLLGDLPVGFGTAKGLNEHGARVTAADRFWLRPPAPFAGTDLDTGPGPARWSPPADRALDSPAAAAELAGEGLRHRFAGWVEALHRKVAERRAQGEDHG